MLHLVWPLPISLATTFGISVDYFSSPYLDVSVQAVPHTCLFDSACADRITPAGFPHSDIPGSQLICSSPRLFAAYHVLRRLLMPRHSPCALYSLTIVEETRSIPLPPFGESFISAPSFSSFAKNRFLAILGTGDAGSKFLLQRQRNLVLLNYAGFTKIFRKL